MRLDGDIKMGVFLGAANRDPRRFENAKRFDVDWPARAGNHIVLRSGVHACSGQMIARLEFEALIGALARKAATLKPTAPATYRPINQVRKLDTLPLRISAA